MLLLKTRITELGEERGSQGCMIFAPDYRGNGFEHGFAIRYILRLEDASSYHEK